MEHICRTKFRRLTIENNTLIRALETTFEKIIKIPGRDNDSSVTRRRALVAVGYTLLPDRDFNTAIRDQSLVCLEHNT